MAGCQYEGKSYGKCTITVELDSSTWRGTLVVGGQNNGEATIKTLLTADVVAGPNTPMGSFTAANWEKDHVSTKYGSLADTPYSKTLFGGNAFGPYQLHIHELEARGIYIHGTMGPSWNPSTELNALISPTSHGCVRMANTGNIALHLMMPSPQGNRIIIRKKGAGK
jgi:lipoprotein-anchoring transpeptidase ErfK/SrfK